MIIYLVLLLPAGSSDLPKAWRAAFISLLFGLASNGVYMCHCCYQQCGSLLHCLSTLTITFAMAVYFCCTGLGVASTGRYPASCPVKPGLSSPEGITFSRNRLSYLPSVVYNIFAENTSYTLKQLPPTNSLHRELLGRLSLVTPRKYSRNLSSLLAS